MLRAVRAYQYCDGGRLITEAFELAEETLCTSSKAVASVEASACAVGRAIERLEEGKRRRILAIPGRAHIDKKRRTGGVKGKERDTLALRRPGRSEPSSSCGQGATA